MDAKWFNQWKTYVGFDDWNTGAVGDLSANPGPIDNSCIITSKKQVVVLSYHVTNICVFVFIGLCMSVD